MVKVTFHFLQCVHLSNQLSPHIFILIATSEGLANLAQGSSVVGMGLTGCLIINWQTDHAH